VALYRDEVPAHDDGAAVRGGFGADVLRRPLDDRADVDGTEHQLRRLREVEEVPDDRAERVRFVADAGDVGAHVGRKALEIEEARVTPDPGGGGSGSARC